MAYWIVLPIIAVRALSGLFLVARTASEASEDTQSVERLLLAGVGQMSGGLRNRH
jgi:hypothetical protein